MKALKYDSFYTYEEWYEFAEQLSKTFPEYVRSKSLVKTEEGRQVIVLEMTDYATGSCEEKPAYYIQAGLHAIEGAGVTAALHVAYSLVTNEAYRPLLKDIAFYIVPCVDPDGSDYALRTHGEIRSRYERSYRKNELVPQDLNGDGYILQMRWQDPFGPYKKDPLEPRLLVQREAGDTEGPFFQVTKEGMLRDFDGTLPVNPMRVVDFNRSYPVNWKPTSNTTGYPLSQPELRAIADYQIARPNIFAGVDFHCGTHAILRADYLPDAQFHAGDLKSILEVGRMAEEITGFPLMSVAADYGFGGGVKTPGNSNDWAYAKLGISHYTIEVGFGYTSLGLKPKEILHADGKTREDHMRRLMALHDQHGSQMFKPWETFHHPQLGEVEIGGLMVGNARFMHPPDMIEVVPKTTEFIARHAALRPKLIFDNVEAYALGEGLYRIRATIGNIGGFSTEIMQAGGSQDMKRPVTIKLDSPGIEILNRHAVQQLNSLAPLGGSYTVEWFIRTAGDVSDLTIIAQHPRAGIATYRLDCWPSQRS